MLDPRAVIHLDAPTTVDTPDGPREDVSRVAVWEWFEKDVDGEGAIRAHTNIGDVYIPADTVDEIDKLADR